MSSDPCIVFDGVSKKFSKSDRNHGTFRDDFYRFLKKNRRTEKLKNDEFWALDQVSFNIHRGQSVGLYGPNGSGKSTLLKLIANVLTPTKGVITLNGRIAPLIELGAGFHPDLNGMENIYLNGAILGMSIGEIKSKMNKIINYSELNNFMSTPVKKYSSGMKLRLGFSIAIHSDADIYLFDEILAVGDEAFRSKSQASINQLLEKNKTLLIVSHNKEKLSQMCELIFHLKKGKMEKNY